MSIFNDSSVWSAAAVLPLSAGVRVILEVDNEAG